MHYAPLIFLILATSTSIFGQSIKWDSNRALVWDDFHATPDASSKFHAQTQSGVKYSYRWQSAYGKTTYTFEVFAYCDKSLSWVKAGKATKRLLAHEQLHFDISELHARKLKQAIAKATFSKQYDSEIKTLFKENQKAREFMQDQYDRETEHMNNIEEQNRWQRYVRDEIIKLQKYGSTEIVN